MTLGGKVYCYLSFAVVSFSLVEESLCCGNSYWILPPDVPHSYCNIVWRHVFSPESFKCSLLFSIPRPRFEAPDRMKIYMREEDETWNENELSQCSNIYQQILFQSWWNCTLRINKIDNKFQILIKASLSHIP